MKKKKNIIIAGVAILLLTLNVKVYASSTTEQQSNSFSIPESSKILKYDAITNETTEVDMDEVKQAITSNYILQKNSELTLNSYNPFQTANMNTIARANSGTDIISDTSILPYIATCKITYNYNGKEQNCGTLSIVGKNLGLTAAHCVFDENNNALKEWKIYPGYNEKINGDKKYYGTVCGWSQVYYSSAWKENQENYKEDWAICILQSDVGNQVGYYGLKAFNDTSNLKDTEIRILGYPEEPSYGLFGRFQYSSYGKITDVYGNGIRTSARTYKGYSGGPILHSDNLIVGVLYGIDSNKKSRGAVITPDMINLITKLRQ